MAFIINIDDDWFSLIKKPVAAPVIDELLLTDDQIKEYAVFPALHEYFKKFPYKIREQKAVNQTIELPFPGADVYGVANIRIVNKGMSKSSNAGYLQLVRYNQMLKSGSRGRRYLKNLNINGSRNDPLLQLQLMASEQNRATFRYEINNENRIVEVFSSIPAEVAITWASSSLDFNHVEHEYKMDVIDLAQAYLCEHVADIVGLIKMPNVDQEISADDFMNKADTKFSRVRDKWNEIPDIILIRH